MYFLHRMTTSSFELHRRPTTTIKHLRRPMSSSSSNKLQRLAAPRLRALRKNSIRFCDDWDLQDRSSEFLRVSDLQSFQIFLRVLPHAFFRTTLRSSVYSVKLGRSNALKGDNPPVLILTSPSWSNSGSRPNFPDSIPVQLSEMIPLALSLCLLCCSHSTHMFFRDTSSPPQLKLGF